MKISNWSFYHELLIAPLSSLLSNMKVTHTHKCNIWDSILKYKVYGIILNRHIHTSLKYNCVFCKENLIERWKCWFLNILFQNVNESSVVIICNEYADSTHVVHIRATLAWMLLSLLLNCSHASQLTWLKFEYSVDLKLSLQLVWFFWWNGSVTTLMFIHSLVWRFSPYS